MNEKHEISALEVILAIPLFLFAVFSILFFLTLIIGLASSFVDGVLIQTNNFETRILKTSFDSKKEIKYTLQRKGLYWTDVIDTYSKDIVEMWQERYNINTFAEKVQTYDGNDIAKESNNQPHNHSKIMYTVPLW